MSLLIAETKSEDYLISALTEETCSENEGTLSEYNNLMTDRESLYRYFHDKNKENVTVDLSSYIQSAQLDNSFFALKYVPETHCYRLSLKGQEVDIPSNWGFIKMLLEKKNIEKSPYLLITKVNDQDFIVEALSDLDHELVGLIAIKDATDIKVISLNEYSQVAEHLNFLDEYFSYQNLIKKI